MKSEARLAKEACYVPVADLKLYSSKPELVELSDAHASDPYWFVYLKSQEFLVPAPAHWSSKRKYMAGKRGMQKPRVKLADCIEITGISKLRKAMVEREAQKSLRQRQAEKLRPKQGALFIDYQLLHDAIFKHQKKPTGLSPLGDIYYECKEFRSIVDAYIPGEMSEELRIALGMPVGKVAPPPWLNNMQRIGPPPSYPHLKIPGLNAPIPPGEQYGHEPGEWGSPPLDAQGNFLYSYEDYSWESLGITESEVNFLWGEIPDLSDDSCDEEKTVTNTVPQESAPTETAPIAESQRAVRRAPLPERYLSQQANEPFQVLHERSMDVSNSTDIMPTARVYSMPGDLSIPNAPAFIPTTRKLNLSTDELRQRLDQAQIKAAEALKRAHQEPVKTSAKKRFKF